MARQLALGDFIGRRPWQLDLAVGTVTFGDLGDFPIQILGTESNKDLSWLWAWANTASGFPPALLERVNALKQRGIDEDIPELTAPGGPLTGGEGHTFSILASGLTERVAYYRGPYDGGAVYMLVEGLPDSVFAVPDAPRAIQVINHVVSNYKIAHRPMLESLFEHYGWHLSPGETSLTVSSPTGDALTIRFDELGRIGGMDAAVHE